MTDADRGFSMIISSVAIGDHCLRHSGVERRMADQSWTGLVSVVLATLLTLPVSCNSRSDSPTTGLKPTASRKVPPARHKPFFQAGFAYCHVGGSYDTDVSSAIKELAPMRQFQTTAKVGAFLAGSNGAHGIDLLRTALKAVRLKGEGLRPGDRANLLDQVH